VQDLSKNDGLVEQFLSLKPRPENVVPYEEDPALVKYTQCAMGYLFFTYNNGTKDKTLNESVTMKDIQSLTICPPFTNSD